MVAVQKSSCKLLVAWAETTLMINIPVKKIKKLLVFISLSPFIKIV